jgi:16S rRNA (uracil1498-N3)-methyltransferase
MHRFYLPPDECRDTPLRLADREAHHARHVLRLRRGEPVTVLDGAGHEFRCTVADAGAKTVRLAVVQKTFVPSPPCPITLLQAVPRGQLIESIIQKATELGARRIVPILSERVTIRLDGIRAADKVEKWRQVAIEAIKQCGFAWLPQVEEPATPKDFLARNENFELPLIASLEGDRRHPGEYFRAFKVQHGRLPHSACVWIGPEGDFAPQEVSAIKAAGALPITLGPRVLRTETAAVYCLSVLSYELQAGEFAV